MNSTFLRLGAAFLLTAFGCRAAAQAPAGSARVQFDAHGRVEIRLLLRGSAAEEAEFAALKKAWRLEVTATTVGPRSERFRDALAACLNEYPSYLSTGVLDNIYLVGRLKFPANNASGTYTGRNILISVDDVPLERVAPVFHHEFSSLLLQRHPGKFPTVEFRAANPPHFQYGRFPNEATRWDPPVIGAPVAGIRTFKTCIRCIKNGSETILACVTWKFQSDRSGDVTMFPAGPLTPGNDSDVQNAYERAKKHHFK